MNLLDEQQSLRTKEDSNKPSKEKNYKSCNPLLLMYLSKELHLL